MLKKLRNKKNSPKVLISKASAGLYVQQSYKKIFISPAILPETFFKAWTSQRVAYKVASYVCTRSFAKPLPAIFTKKRSKEETQIKTKLKEDLEVAIKSSLTVDTDKLEPKIDFTSRKFIPSSFYCRRTLTRRKKIVRISRSTKEKDSLRGFVELQWQVLKFLTQFHFKSFSVVCFLSLTYKATQSYLCSMFLPFDVPSFSLSRNTLRIDEKENICRSTVVCAELEVVWEIFSNFLSSCAKSEEKKT